MRRRTKPTLHPTVEKAKKRVSRLPTADLLSWADVAGAGVARALSDYQRAGDPDSLEDAHEGLLSMLGVVEAMRERV